MIQLSPKARQDFKDKLHSDVISEIYGAPVGSEYKNDIEVEIAAEKILSNPRIYGFIFLGWMRSFGECHLEITRFMNGVNKLTYRKRVQFTKPDIEVRHVDFDVAFKFLIEALDKKVFV